MSESQVVGDQLRQAAETARDALDTAKTGLKWYRDSNPDCVDGSDDEADEQIDAAIASLTEALAVPQVPAARVLPHPGSAEASAMLDSLLAEYQWPANSKNAARAGWEAANRWLARPTAAVPAGPMPGFPLKTLADIAEGLEKGYERSFNVGDECPEVESTTAYAARFIRAFISARASCPAPLVPVGQQPADPEQPNAGTAHPAKVSGEMAPPALSEDTRDQAGVPAGEWAGLSPKQAWWAGYRVGKGLPPDMPRSQAVAAAPGASSLDSTKE